MRSTAFDVDTPFGPAHVDLDRPDPSVSDPPVSAPPADGPSTGAPPAGGPVALLTLAHGASGGVQSRDLIAIRNAAVAANIVVARTTQPYRVAGRRAPAPPPQLDEALAAMVAALRRRSGLRTLPLVLGGRSNGARVACRSAAACRAAGVLALAFPEHPPGRPDRSRMPELDAVAVPVLVVQGRSDPFGMPAPGPNRRVVVVNGNHSLGTDLRTIADSVVEFVLGLATDRR